jgi:hypothetical protein
MKAIFPFSPGKVANAEGWLDGNIVKMLDARMTVITPITTSRKP